MNIKFPKEQIRIIEDIRNAVIKKSKVLMQEQYDNVLLNCKFLEQYCPSLLDQYIKTLFEIREFELLINIVEDLKRKDIENCLWYYYMFAILILKKDIHYAKSIIKRSSLLNDNSIKYLISEDEGNYNSIISLHSTLLTTIGPCLILVNFINELFNESLKIEITDEYIIMRFFDLLNLLFEYGVDEEIIEMVKNTLETIYEIDIV